MPDAPNVIVFFTDQQRWDSTGLHGNPLGLTPNLDAFAREHTHLAQCFTPQPVCGPARACMQTGTYATTNGSWRNGIPLNPELPTMAQCFADAGYRTGYIGKWHLADPSVHGSVRPEQRGGYQDWLAANVLELVSDAYHCIVYDEEGCKVKLPGYRVDALTDAAIRYIDRHQHDPFFLFLSLLEPHQQNNRDEYAAPRGYADRYRNRWTPPDLASLPGHYGAYEGITGGSAQAHLPGYWGMVRRIDEAFGRLLDSLDSLGLDTRTIVLFTSDHGCHFKTRAGEYKRSCHDSSMRVPGAIGGPGFRNGGRIDHPISLIDVMPSLLDACDIKVPSTVQGRSILPLLRREQIDWPEQVFAQISESQVGRVIRTKRWKYAVVGKDADGKQLSAADHYVDESLYDLEIDPYELRNLVFEASHASVCDEMRSRLIRCMLDAGEAEPIIRHGP